MNYEQTKKEWGQRWADAVFGRGTFERHQPAVIRAYAMKQRNLKKAQHEQATTQNNNHPRNANATP